MQVCLQKYACMQVCMFVCMYVCTLRAETFARINFRELKKFAKVNAHEFFWKMVIHESLCARNVQVSARESCMYVCMHECMHACTHFCSQILLIKFGYFPDMRFR